MTGAAFTAAGVAAGVATEEMVVGCCVAGVVFVGAAGVCLFVSLHERRGEKIKRGVPFSSMHSKKWRKRKRKRQERVRRQRRLGQDQYQNRHRSFRLHKNRGPEGGGEEYDTKSKAQNK